MLFSLYFIAGTLLIVTLCSENNSSLETHQDQHSHLHHKHSDRSRSKNISGTMRICGSFFQKEESMKHFQQCVAEQDTAEGVPSSSSEEEREKHLTMNGTRIKDHSRLERDAFHAGNQRGHRHWKMFENVHVYRNPCLVECVLTKFQMVNSTGHIDLLRMQARAVEILNMINATEAPSKATNITKLCSDERQKDEQDLWTAHNMSLVNTEMYSDVMLRTKCRFIIQFGKCMVHQIFNFCREEFHRTHGIGSLSQVSTTTVTVLATND